MSAGTFLDTFYETNGGDVWLARIQPETITGWNPAASGPATVLARANMTGGKRRNGVVARTVSLSFGDTPPTGYKANSIIRIPVMTQDAWENLVKGSTVSYLTGSARVAGKSPERVN